MKIKGCYVVFGSELAPIVQLLSANASALFLDRCYVVGQKKAIVATFVKGAEYALPAWSVECMEHVALNYEGPHAAVLKPLCAAIALGKPYGGAGYDGNDYGDGGERVPLKDAPKGKGGPAVAVPDGPAIMRRARKARNAEHEVLRREASQV